MNVDLMPSSFKSENAIFEKATSKSQQRLFGMVHAYNKGELDDSDVDGDLYNKIKKIANGMTKKDAKKMAKTDHDDLPNKVFLNSFFASLIKLPAACLAIVFGFPPLKNFPIPFP